MMFLVKKSMGRYAPRMVMVYNISQYQPISKRNPLLWYNNYKCTDELLYTEHFHSCLNFFPHYINSPSFSVGKLKTTTIKQFEIYCPTKVRQPE